MRNRFFSNRIRKNRGMTLVEVTVTFALLGIFLACAASIITMIAGQYYRVNGETYSKQVTDIIMEKISSEIEGAKYDPSEPQWTGENEEDAEILANPVYSTDFLSMSVYDRTDTRVKLRQVNGELLVEYYQFTDKIDTNKSRNATVWKFDSNVYNGYSIEELYFVRGDKLENFTDAEKYGLSTDEVTYGTDVVVVFMKLHHSKYEDYYTYRVIKMYYVDDATTSTNNESGGTGETGESGGHEGTTPAP